MVKKSWNLALLCALLVLLLSVLPCVVSGDQNGAANAISNARNQILSCFDALKEAEAEGANITELTAILNEAGLLLSRAEFAFSVGDFTAAQDHAVQSQSELVNFVSDAKALLFTAAESKTLDFLINVVGSTVGTAAVLVGGFGLWVFLKKKYENNGEEELESATA